MWLCADPFIMWLYFLDQVGIKTGIIGAARHDERDIILQAPSFAMLKQPMANKAASWPLI